MNSLLRMLKNNLIGEGEVDSVGEKIGRGINRVGQGGLNALSALYNDPVGVAGGAVNYIHKDLNNLMFEGGAMERPEAVFNYVGGTAAPGILRNAGKFDPNTLNAFKAYHGSPHDFDKFSMDKIGTGEGAQAYGHGLYFAEKPEVARDYRDALSGPRGRFAAMPKFKALDGEPKYIPDGWAQDIADFGESAINRRIAAIDGDVARLKQQAADDPSVAGLIDDIIAPYEAERVELNTLLREGVDNDRPKQGRLYEVEIDANPEDFLDWDAPLSEQPEGIRGAFQRFSETNPEHVDPVTAGGQYENPTGKDFLGAYGEAVPHDPNDMFNYRRKFTDDMKAQGIPGIRYKDQGSRGTDGGTHNYVVFDDNIISIVKKYGVAGAAAMLGLPASEVEAKAGDYQRGQEIMDYLDGISR